MILHNTNIFETDISGGQKPLGVLLIKWNLEITLSVSRPSLGSLFFPVIQGWAHKVLDECFTSHAVQDGTSEASLTL